MPNYLHIGGAKDGQLFPVADGAGPPQALTFTYSTH